MTDLTLPAFQAALHTPFRVRAEAAAEIELVLVEARATGSSPASECFSLLFQGPTVPVLPQRMYPFTHPEFGTFELFIVPVGQDRNGLRYEAVFNRSAAGPARHGAT